MTLKHQPVEEPTHLELAFREALGKAQDAPEVDVFELITQNLEQS